VADLEHRAAVSAPTRSPAPESHTAPPADRRALDTAAAIVRRRGVPGALVVVVYLAAQLLFRMPLFPSDQVIYYRAAAAFPDVAAEHWQLRVGLLIPVKVTMWLFGQAEAAYYVVPIAAGMLLAWSTYMIGALLFDRGIGFVAGIAGTVNSLVLLDSSLLPDVLASALFASAMALVLWVCKTRPQHATLARRELGALAGAGVLLGWSYLAREFVAFLFVLVPIAFALWRVNWRPALAAVAAPAFAVFLGECLLNLIVHGEPFVRLSVAAGHGQGALDPAVAATFQNQPMSVILMRLPEALLEQPEGLWTVVGLAALLSMAALKRSRALVILALWILAFWIPLTLLGGILDPSSPSLRIQKIRYWFPIFPALYVGAVAVLAYGGALAAERLPQGSLRRAVPSALLGFALAVSLVVTTVHLSAQTDAFRSTGATHLDALRRYLERSPVTTVWTDSRTASMLPISLAGDFGSGRTWKGAIQVLTPAALPALERPSGGRVAVVVYSGDDEGRPCGFCRQSLAKTLGDPPRIPSSWQLAAASGDQLLRVYLVR
jgi:hypothetical protein